MNVVVYGGYITPAFYTHQLTGTALGPDNAPKVCRVSLLAESGGILGNLAPPNYQQLAVARSQADGSWVFKRIPDGQMYTAIAYDDTGQYDPVVKAGLIPEPMKD